MRNCIMHNTEQKQQLSREGFTLIKNVFTPEEIKNFRAAAYEAKTRETQMGLLTGAGKLSVLTTDLLSNPGLNHLPFDPRILSIVRDIVGREQLVYFGESGLIIGTGSRGFHRDNADRINPTAPDWSDPNYSVVKVGIYCQDNAKHSGGLKIRRGSHLVSDFIPGKNTDVVGKGSAYNIPNAPGDVAIWSLKTAHSANFLRLKLLPNIALTPWLEWQLLKFPSFRRQPENGERIFLYSTYAAPDTSAQRYISYYLDRGDYHEHWRRSKYSQDLAQKAQQANVEFRRPIADYGS